mgnify:CR=1 FL=1
MNSLTNNCSLLLGENVLPSNSIYYQKYVILNKINTLVINGKQIDQRTKSELYSYLLNNKKTTFKGLVRTIRNKFDLSSTSSVSGLNEEDSIISDSYCLFKDFFGVESLDADKLEIAERIIFICAIYKDNILDSFDQIESELGIPLTEKQKQLLKSKNFGGWGKFSKKLLNGIKYIDDSGVAFSILDILEQTVFNFNQILHSPVFGFEKIINAENSNQIYFQRNNMSSIHE